MAMPLIPRQFFPSSDRPELLVDISLPQNASIYASEAAAERFDALLKDDPDVERWSTYVGRGAIRFYLPLDVQLPNSFFSQAVIVAKDVDARDRLQAKLEEALARDFPNAVARVSPLELGPPVGWPIQYRVSGPDISEVREIALKLAAVISANPNTESVNFDWLEPARQLRIRVDQDEARLLGLSSQSVARILDTVVSGVPVTQIRDDIYLVNVVARATDEQRVSIDSLRTLQVPLPNGRTVPLAQFASFDYEQEYPLIWRRDRMPNLTVQSDIRPGMLPEEVVSALTEPIAELSRSLPAGYAIAVGGTVEESAKSQASVLAVVPIMFFIMLTVLMFQLQGFQRLLIVLSVGPLGLIGVVGALLAVGPAARLRRHSGHPGPARHDHQECRDPAGPDRRRARAGQGRADGRAGRLCRPLPAHHADGGLDRAGHDSDCLDGVLGSHGLCHHGRTPGGDDPDAGLSSRPLRDLVRLAGEEGRKPAHGTSRSESTLSGRSTRGESSHGRSAAAAARQGLALPASGWQSICCSGSCLPERT